MHKLKNIAILLLTGLLIILFIVDIAAAIHSTWFMLTHIHLTRMEAIFDPGNYILYKLLCVGATYLDFKAVTSLAENY